MAIEYAPKKEVRLVPQGFPTPKKPADRRGIIAIDSFEDEKPEPKREPIPSKAKRGRPKTDFDKEEYNRLYMRDLRTIKRLGLTCTVKEWRDSNGNG